MRACWPRRRRARAPTAHFRIRRASITPSDRPAEIILATNFGLVLSEDAGQSWQWSCERDANAYGILYQQGPAPRHRLFTVAGDKLVFSDDGSCGWQTAAGALAAQLVTDAFPDPNDADHVLAIGYDGGIFGVFPSRDGGRDLRCAALPGGRRATGSAASRSRAAMRA